MAIERAHCRGDCTCASRQARPWRSSFSADAGRSLQYIAARVLPHLFRERRGIGAAPPSFTLDNAAPRGSRQMTLKIAEDSEKLAKRAEQCTPDRQKRADRTRCRHEPRT